MSERTACQPETGLPETGLFTKNGYIQNQKIHEIFDKKTLKKSVEYSATVTSIIPEQYGTILNKYGHLFGEEENQSEADCGEKFRKLVCAKNEKHHAIFRTIHCNEPGCPICFTKFIVQMAQRVTERVQGYKTTYRNNRMYHLILWGEKQGEEYPVYKTLKDAMKEGNRLLKILGVDAAVMWYHAYRIREELKPQLRRIQANQRLQKKRTKGFWELARENALGIGALENYIVYGPHWHCIADGWLIPSKDFNIMTGGGYKKKRYLTSEKAVFETAYYISSHCIREAEKSSVRYFGAISYKMLHREHIYDKIHDVLCPICKANLLVFPCNCDGVLGEKIADKVTEKIRYYLYWKAGDKMPDMAEADAHQCCITRFNIFSVRNGEGISW